MSKGWSQLSKMVNYLLSSKSIGGGELPLVFKCCTSSQLCLYQYLLWREYLFVPLFPTLVSSGEGAFHAYFSYNSKVGMGGWWWSCGSKVGKELQLFLQPLLKPQFRMQCGCMVVMIR